MWLPPNWDKEHDSSRVRTPGIFKILEAEEIDNTTIVLPFELQVMNFKKISETLYTVQDWKKILIIQLSTFLHGGEPSLTSPHSPIASGTLMLVAITGSHNISYFGKREHQWLPVSNLHSTRIYDSAWKSFTLSERPLDLQRQETLFLILQSPRTPKDDDNHTRSAHTRSLAWSLAHLNHT